MKEFAINAIGIIVINALWVIIFLKGMTIIKWIREKLHWFDNIEKKPSKEPKIEQRFGNLDRQLDNITNRILNMPISPRMLLTPEEVSMIRGPLSSYRRDIAALNGFIPRRESAESDLQAIHGISFTGSSSTISTIQYGTGLAETMDALYGIGYYETMQMRREQVVIDPPQLGEQGRKEPKVKIHPNGTGKQMDIESEF